MVNAAAETAGQPNPRAVILVEGLSDRYALEVLARRRGRDLDAERVRIVAMQGATNIGHFLDKYGPRGLGVPLAGLYDIAERDIFRRALEGAGFGSGLTCAQMERLGFFGCSADLEDELIRAIGIDRVEQIIAAQGELRSLRLLQMQPPHKGGDVTVQLRCFMKSRSGRKYRYACLLAATVDLARVPRSLDGALSHSAAGRDG